MITTASFLKFVGFTHQCLLRKNIGLAFLNLIRALGLIFSWLAVFACIYIILASDRVFYLFHSLGDAAWWIWKGTKLTDSWTGGSGWIRMKSNRRAKVLKSVFEHGRFESFHTNVSLNFWVMFGTTPRQSTVCILL